MLGSMLELWGEALCNLGACTQFVWAPILLDSSTLQKTYPLGARLLPWTMPLNKSLELKLFGTCKHGVKVETTSILKAQLLIPNKKIM
jgi:hypothetical protein